MPLYAGISAILFFASMGLPGLCGFVGELFVMMAAWNFSPALAIPAILSVDPDRGLPALDVAARLPRHEPGDAELTPSLSPREAACLLPFAVLAILPGRAAADADLQLGRPERHRLGGEHVGAEASGAV